jgi:hypothetical protein
MRSRPAESATGPIKEIPHRGRVTVWPQCALWPHIPGLGLSRPAWPTPQGRFSCTPHTGDAHCSQRKADLELPGAYRKPSGLHCIGHDAQTRQSESRRRPVRCLKSSRHFPLTQLVCYALLPVIYPFTSVEGRPDFR